MSVASSRPMEREERFRALRAGVRTAILDRHGACDPATRLRAYEGEGTPGAVAAYVATVKRSAVAVEDAMVAALREEGLDDAAIFELTAATAIGEATRQFEAAMRALEEALAERKG